MDRILALLRKYKEPILYLVFGGLTTLINIVVYALLTRAMSMELTLATILAWVAAVIFAYVTNRKWVFQSRAAGFKPILGEAAAFFGGRIFSGLLDLGIMFLFAEKLGFNDLLIKIISNVIVIILNYIISKWIVFRKHA